MSEPTQLHDSEVALLGSAIGGCFELDTLLDLVEADDFYTPWHGDVWAAIGAIHRSGNLPDLPAVAVALKGETAGKRVHELITPWSSPDPRNHADAIVAAAGHRRLQEAAVRINQLGSTFGDLQERQEQARQAIDDATRNRRGQTAAQSVRDLLPETLDAAQHGSRSSLDTGWPDVDRLIGGLSPGRLVVVGARPGGGKSIAGTNLALRFAHHHGHGVLLCSLEMMKGEVMNRLLSSHASVNLTNLENSTVDESSWGRLAAKTAELEAMPLFINDESNASAQTIRKLARDVQRKRPDLAVIIVDYLQLMKPTQGRRGASRAEEVSAIARDLKLLARETGACVVAMAQVNREGANQNDGPRLTDLREGGIENDADQVILLHRKSLDSADVTVTVAKNRHGPIGVSTLQLQGHYASLRSVSWSPTTALGRSA